MKVLPWISLRVDLERFRNHAQPQLQFRLQRAGTHRWLAMPLVEERRALVLLLSICVAAAAIEAEQCRGGLPKPELSEYASIGQLQPYVGEVDTVEGLTRAMNGCSYKKETVLLTTNDKFVDAAAQTVDMLRCVHKTCMPTDLLSCQI
jgi:hypothetical protein